MDGKNESNLNGLNFEKGKISNLEKEIENLRK